MGVNVEGRAEAYFEFCLVSGIFLAIKTHLSMYHI